MVKNKVTCMKKKLWKYHKEGMSWIEFIKRVQGLRMKKGRYGDRRSEE